MKILSTLLAGSALVAASGAAAQTAPAQSGETPNTATETDAMAAESPFTDEQIQQFAAAALKIAELEGTAATQQQLADIVTNSGLEPATYVAIAQAMKTDPALAERVQVAANAMRNNSAG